MKAIHTKSQPNISTKDERISTRENPASNSISSNSSSIHDSSSFAPRRANKLKEFFGLFSIHNKLPQTRGGGTSQHTELSLKESSAKNLSIISETKVNSVSGIDNEKSRVEFHNRRGKNKSTLKNYIKFNHNIRLVGSLSVIMLMVIATGIIVPYYIKTNNSEATAGQAIGSTLTFSAESLTASVSLSNLDKDGTFATSGTNERAKFSIATDNFTGYTLTMRTSDGNTLKSADPTTNTDTFTSVTSNISASTFSNSANTTYNNQWGIIPNYYYSNNATIANTDTYLKVPAANESITLDVTSAKNAEAKNYTIGIGARADYTNKIDTYSNTFILEYIANPVTYSITYNANAGSDTVTNMPTTNPQTGSTSAGEAVSIPLYTNIPERTGYSFKGWCSVSTSNDTCSGTIYNDQTVEAANRIMNYGIDQTIDNTTVTLNAMWHQEAVDITIKAATNVPTVTLNGTSCTDTSTGCVVSLAPGQAYTLTASPATGYNVTWSATAGTIASVSSASTTYTPGDSSATITVTAAVKTNLSLKVSFNSTMVSSVAVKSGSASGTTVATISTSGNSATGLTYNTNYYLVPSYKSGYGFKSWAKDSGAVGTLSSTTAANPYYRIGDGTNAVTLTAQQVYSATFTAGSNIDLIMVADGSRSNNYRPQYATSGGSTSVTAAPGTKLIVTVVPKANYKLSSWSGTTTGLASTSLLTTTYTMPSSSNTLTAVGVSGTYIAMKDSSCSEAGSNVTDERNGISYTVAKIGNYCYMLSNLRLAGGTALSTTTSNVSSSYTLPSDTGNSGWTNDYCKPYMATKNNEYYYNWPAATARTNSTSSTSGSNGCSNDTSNSKGDICPYNWSLPTYDSDITGANAWNSGANPAMLSTTGYFRSGSQLTVGSYGYWWSSTRYTNNNAYYLRFSGTSADRSSNAKFDGFSVRCMRKIPEMQNITSVTLATLLPNNGDTTTLADSRDGEAYTIGKLNDKYWMLDNLRLGGSSAMTLTGENTNLATTSTTYTLPASGEVCFASDDCTGTDGTTTGNGYTVAAINADYKNATHKKDDSSATFTYNSNGDVSKAGVYYNYCAASAGTICDAADSNNNNAQYDICPKGWRLPTGGRDANTSEFRALANNLGNVTTGNLTDTAYTDFKAAFHAGLSGYFYNRFVLNQTNNVYFWSSTRSDGNNMYHLYVYTSTVYPQSSGYRYRGLSVRCVYGG